MSTGPVLDAATLAELRRLAQSRPRSGRQSVAKASAWLRLGDQDARAARPGGPAPADPADAGRLVSARARRPVLRARLGVPARASPDPAAPLGDGVARGPGVNPPVCYMRTIMPSRRVYSLRLRSTSAGPARRGAAPLRLSAPCFGRLATGGLSVGAPDVVAQFRHGGLEPSDGVAQWPRRLFAALRV